MKTSRLAAMSPLDSLASVCGVDVDDKAILLACEQRSFLDRDADPAKKTAPCMEVLALTPRLDQKAITQGLKP